MNLKKGQVIWANLAGIGSEQLGNRPCIVVQNDIGNKFSQTTIVVPLTTRRPEKLLPTQLSIEGYQISSKFRDSTVLTEQIKNIDITRISKIQTQLPNDLVQEIDSKILTSLGISDNFS